MQSLRSALIIFSRRAHTKNYMNLDALKIKTKSKATSDLHNLLINMPKEQPHIPVLKSARKQKKESVGKFPAGYITLQVLGNGAKGAPSSLYLFTDQTRSVCKNVQFPFFLNTMKVKRV